MAANTYYEIGDTGQSIASAQSATSVNNLSSIGGTIGPNGDVDMFKFYTSGGNFTAAPLPDPIEADPRLFLFDANGYCIFGIEDDEWGPLATVVDYNLIAGFYYIAITSWPMAPVSEGGSMFMNTLGSPGVKMPTGPGGTQKLSGWVPVTDPPYSDEFMYNIELIGVTSKIPDTGSTIAMIGAAFWGLALIRRKLAA